MKKTLKKTAWIFLFLMVLAGLSVNVYARAGGATGGGGGSSSGGSSSGGSSGHYYRSHSGRAGSGRGGMAGTVAMIGMFLIIRKKHALMLIVRSKSAAVRTKRKMLEYAQHGGDWDIQNIQGQVRQAYFEIQECWRRQDADYAKAYLSEKCYQEFQTKLGWMEVRNERAVQENIRLLSAVPVQAFDGAFDAQDYVVYLIHGSMVDYCVDGNSGKMLKGSKRNEAFYEYWTFVRQDGRWVLDEIAQENEIDIDRL